MELQNKKIPIDDLLKERDEVLAAWVTGKEVADRFPEDAVTQQYLRRAASYLVEGVPEDWTGVWLMEEK